MSEMIWCDVCKEPHVAEDFDGHTFMVCPAAPPNTITFFDPDYVQHFQIPDDEPQ